MKKISLAVTLLLVVVGSWAFYPKAPAEPGYMQLSVRVSYSGKPSLVAIAPDGEETSYTLDSKSKPTRSLQSQALVKLNELRSQGWTVVQMTSNENYVLDANHPLLSPDRAFRETYLLEKR
jgi:hypothetical protein